MIHSLPYRPGVGMMVFNRNGEVFVAKRIDTISEAWQMPQGGIDTDEDPRTAALRELKEEIGTDDVEILAESREWLSYDLPEHLVPKIWGGRFRGQRQKWYAMRFLGADADINIHTHEPEFSEWKWAALPQVPTLIVPFKRALYAQLVEEFSGLVA